MPMNKRVRRAIIIAAVWGVVAALVTAAVLRTAGQASRSMAAYFEAPAYPTPVAMAKPAATPDPVAALPPGDAHPSTPAAAPLSGPLDEPSLMAQMRAVQDTDPARARELALEGNRRFPESPGAAERAAIAIKGLALQGKLSEARGEAETMVRKYPDSPWAIEVERHTGAHRHPPN